MVPSGPNVSGNTGSGSPSMDLGGQRLRAALRHRVVPARRPRVAAAQPARREPAPADAAALGHGLEGVRRAAGVVTAHLTVEGADQGPIPTQQPDQDVLHDLAPVVAPAGVATCGVSASTRRRQRPSSTPSSALVMAAEAGSARTTSVADAGRSDKF